MYLGIDIGGSKTILAVFSPDGQLLHQYKLGTNPDYQLFLNNLKQTLDEQFQKYQITYYCCAIPGLVDHTRGIGLHFGNLNWQNTPIKQDISSLVGQATVLIENDAKLAALSEALLLHGKYKKVLYVTIGTGIGAGIIINDKIDQDLLDSEPGHMVLYHEGALLKWESFASGKALFQRFGKKAREIDDPAVWETYAGDLAQGIDVLLAVIQPDIVIIGGGVGAHFDKFGVFLKSELQKIVNDMVQLPPIVKAQRPEEAVIYGCYEYIKQNA